jgi:hypothetical protein
MSRNRLGVTVRFDTAEQKILNKLCSFYQQDPKYLLKLGFALLAQSTEQVKKQQEEMNEKINTSTSDNGVPASTEQATDQAST